VNWGIFKLIFSLQRLFQHHRFVQKLSTQKPRPIYNTGDKTIIYTFSSDTVNVTNLFCGSSILLKLDLLIRDVLNIRSLYFIWFNDISLQFPVQIMRVQLGHCILVERIPVCVYWHIMRFGHFYAGQLIFKLSNYMRKSTWSTVRVNIGFPSIVRLAKNESSSV